jgi:hypothetical protein
LVVQCSGIGSQKYFPNFTMLPRPPVLVENPEPCLKSHNNYTRVVSIIMNSCPLCIYVQEMGWFMYCVTWMWTRVPPARLPLVGLTDLTIILPCTQGTATTSKAQKMACHRKATLRLAALIVQSRLDHVLPRLGAFKYVPRMPSNPVWGVCSKMFQCTRFSRRWRQSKNGDSRGREPVELLKLATKTYLQPVLTVETVWFFFPFFVSAFSWTLFPFSTTKILREIQKDPKWKCFEYLGRDPRKKKRWRL